MAMRYRRTTGPRLGRAYRCPDCGCYYDFYCPVEYGCRFCRSRMFPVDDEYFPREVDYWMSRYGYRKARHYMPTEAEEREWEEADKEGKKKILKAELEEIEKDMAEIKEELEEMEKA